MTDEKSTDFVLPTRNKPKKKELGVFDRAIAEFADDQKLFKKYIISARKKINHDDSTIVVVIKEALLLFISETKFTDDRKKRIELEEIAREIVCESCEKIARKLLRCYENIFPSKNGENTRPEDYDGKGAQYE